MMGCGRLWETAFCAVFQIPVDAFLESTGMAASMSLRRRVALARGRTDLTECRMSTTLVIIHLEVVEQRHLCVAVAREPIRFLFLHGRVEALHHRIVVAVGAPTHAARDPV